MRGRYVYTPEEAATTGDGHVSERTTVSGDSQNVYEVQGGEWVEYNDENVAVKSGLCDRTRVW
jgi:hypothetical protein